MGRYYDQAMLRNDYMFGEVVESAIRNVAREILDEPADTPYHEARALMAREIIETNSQRRDEFRARVLFEAVMYDPVLEAAVVDGRVAAERVPDSILGDGIRAIWNQVTLAVWPDVLDEVASAGA